MGKEMPQWVNLPEERPETTSEEIEAGIESEKNIKRILLEGFDGAHVYEDEANMVREILKEDQGFKEVGGMNSFLKKHPRFKRGIQALVLTTSLAVPSLAMAKGQDQAQPTANQEIEAPFVEALRETDQLYELQSTPLSETAGEEQTEISNEDETAQQGEQTAEAEKIMTELNEHGDAYIKDLSLWKKLGLVQEIKNNVDGIKKLAFEDDGSVLSEVGGDLRHLLEKYSETFKEIKKKDIEVYKRTVSVFMDKIDTL